MDTERGRDWSDVSISQGTPGASRSCNRQGKTPSRAFGGSTALQHLDRRRPAARTVTEYISAVGSHSVLTSFGGRKKLIHLATKEAVQDSRLSRAAACYSL